VAEDKREGTVYVLFARSGECMYVGMTLRGDTRIRDHSRQKKWWKRVAKAEFYHPIGLEKTRALEAKLIREYEPIHNVQRPPSGIYACLRCGAITRSGERCPPCATYRRTHHGKERPQHLIDEQIERDLASQLVREVKAAYS
jgi:rubrerythrin